MNSNVRITLQAEIAFSILFFEVLTYVLSYVLEQKEVEAINEKLKADREKLCVSEGGSINEKDE